MQLEATEKPIRYRLKTGEEVTLRPGVPTEIPDHAANQLLKKAPDKVRLVKEAPPTRNGPRISWQRADGTQHTATIDLLHIDADGALWAFVTMQDGGWAAVNAKYLERIES
jgi:hypothetical protein